MDVSPLVWGLTIAGIVGLLLFDFYFHVRKAHVPTLREAAIWSSLYVGIAILFGLGVLVLGGTTPGGEYFAGYITEKALSVDNLFVFLIIMSSFRVPREDQQKVLLFGIAFALVARTGFIFLGAALINSFAWVFYALRRDPHPHRGQHAQVRPRRRGRDGRQLRDPDRPQGHPHHRALRRRQALHHPGRQAGDDPDAAGHGRHRGHRHPLRPRLDPGHLRPDPGHLPGLHRRGVLAARACASCSSSSRACWTA